jgi:catechol 2,3-dioxygenase-like lactoylglutathione lyase family enzyme
MRIISAAPQLRTTDLARTICFSTTHLGATLEFEHEDFYAAIRLGEQTVHLKLVDERDPSIPYVRDADHLHLYLATDDVRGVADSLRRAGVPLVRDVHDTAWGTRELVVEDDQGHRLYVGQPLRSPRS